MKGSGCEGMPYSRGGRSLRPFEEQLLAVPSSICRGTCNHSLHGGPALRGRVRLSEDCAGIERLRAPVAPGRAVAGSGADHRHRAAIRRLSGPLAALLPVQRPRSSTSRRTTHVRRGARLGRRDEGNHRQQRQPRRRLPLQREPIRGCMHGCAYCYASPGHFGAGTDFNTQVDPRKNKPGSRAGDPAGPGKLEPGEGRATVSGGARRGAAHRPEGRAVPGPWSGRGRGACRAVHARTPSFHGSRPSRGLSP
jgi:hypothetical protein